jgi:hypothetical protein
VANDPALHIRRALVAALKSAGLAGGRVYGPHPPANPQWPFILVGSADAAPMQAQCLDGSQFTLTVHTFDKGADEAGAAELNRAVAGLLDRKPLPLTAPFPASMRALRWVRSQIIRDTAEATAWHGLVSISGTVSS